MKLAALALPLLLASSPAPLLEHHWRGEGVCNGKDQLPILAKNWEGVPLAILKAQIVFQPDGRVMPNSYVFAGDSTPGSDIMAYGLAERGTAFTLAETMPAPMPLGVLNHVDLHVGCAPVGVHYQVLEIVWYVKAPSLVSERQAP